MADENPCIQSAINDYFNRGYDSKCAYVQDACADSTSTIDFFSFYYCTLDENLLYFTPFSLLFLFFMFYAVSTTAENYLEPVLSRIAKIFKFSESLSGVTLVALANGAPDVIAAWAAGGNADTGVLVPLGALFGAGIFTACLILCVCIFVSPGKKVQTDKDALTRDCFFYLIASIYFLAFGFVGKIYLWTILVVFLMYFIFIGVAVYYEVKFRRTERIRLLQEAESRAGGPSFELSFHHMDSETIEQYMSHSILSPQLSEGDLNPEDSVNAQSPTTFAKEKNRKALRRYASHSTHSKMLFEFHNLKHKMKNEISDLLGKNCLGKVLQLFSFPLDIVRKGTVVGSHEGDWNKTLAIFQPFFCTAFLIWQFDYLEEVFTDPINIAIWAVMSLAFSLVIWRFTLPGKVPEGALGLTLSFVAFAAAGAWINLISNVIVDYITLLSVFTGLPLNFIGLTLLAWGNSLPDFFVDTTLAKKGLGQAAVSGVFAGQYFNLALGFSLALLRQIAQNGAIDFDLTDLTKSNIVNIILMGSVIIILIITMIYGYVSKYVLKRGFAYFLIVYYAIFFIAVTALSLF